MGAPRKSMGQHGSQMIQYLYNRGTCKKRRLGSKIQCGTIMNKRTRHQADNYSVGFNLSMMAMRTFVAQGFSPSVTAFSWHLSADETLDDFRSSNTRST